MKVIRRPSNGDLAGSSEGDVGAIAAIYSTKSVEAPSPVCKQAAVVMNSIASRPRIAYRRGARQVDSLSLARVRCSLAEKTGNAGNPTDPKEFNG
ncbi:MAG TPA: hypothetical protein VGV87_16950 [Blastocatellia bacterium]|jgi:hypothetical protein|nr:hypothetical protein [Blastocatellia bacterium]